MSLRDFLVALHRWHSYIRVVQPLHLLNKPILDSLVDQELKMQARRYMRNVIDRVQENALTRLILEPKTNNGIWGKDFLLPDSASFIGDKGHLSYEEIIKEFCTIWEICEVKVKSAMH